jgi:hypothetical protein
LCWQGMLSSPALLDDNIHKQLTLPDKKNSRIYLDGGSALKKPLDFSPSYFLRY